MDRLSLHEVILRTEQACLTKPLGTLSYYDSSSPPVYREYSSICTPGYLKLPWPLPTYATVNIVQYYLVIHNIPKYVGRERILIYKLPTCAAVNIVQYYLVVQNIPKYVGRERILIYLLPTCAAVNIVQYYLVVQNIPKYVGRERILL